MVLSGLRRMAWRNLWRNHRRTLIMLAAISIGTWGMIFTTALLKGMLGQMVIDGIRMLPGHVQVHHPAYRDDPSVENSIAEPGPRLLQALSDPLVTAWGGRVKVPAVVASERDSRGVTLLGVDPDREIALGFDPADIVEGRFLESSEDNGLVVGRKLLERLETRLGKRIVIMSQDPDNEIAERGMRIVGVFAHSLPAREEGQVYAGLKTVQDLLQIPGKVSEIAVAGDDFERTEGLLALVEEAAPENSETLDWRAIDEMLGQTQGMVGAIVWLMTVVIFLALSFGLANTFMMAVFERVREIGLMKALGMRPSSIVMLIQFESAILLVIGVIVGNVLAVAAVHPIRDGLDLSMWAEALARGGMSPTLVPMLERGDMMVASIVVLVLGTLTSLLPALRASRLDPVRAINKT
jgi:ABC-type lipoprotein release transport system permease subunit